MVEKRLSHSGRLITVAEGDLLRHITLLDQLSGQRHQDLWPCSIVHYKAKVAAARTPTSSALAAGWVHDAANLRGYIAKQLHTTALGSQIWQMDKRMSIAEATLLARDVAMKDKDIDYVEPDRIVTAHLTVNDPYFTSGTQWDLIQPTAGINVQSAWDRSTGSGVVVAVIDTGYRPHADLAANVVAGYDFISDATRANDGGGRDASPLDPGDYLSAGECAKYPNGAASTWHGTHVAGTIAALANNSAGVAGVAFGAKVQPVRVLGKCGGYDSDIVDAILWASGASVPGVPANPTPARVINLSLGGPGSCGSSFAAAINTARSRGAVVVASAGNDNVNVSNAYPANCPGVMAIASVGSAGAKASDSNYGSLIALAAPGMGIMSTFNSGNTTPSTDSYALASGTSMAAPHVSGVAALMLAANPSLPVDDVAWKMIQNTRAFPVSCSGCGSGLLDASRAVNAVVGYVPPTVPRFTVTLLSDDGINATWQVSNGRSAPVILGDLSIDKQGLIIGWWQGQMGPGILSSSCAVGSWIGAGASCTVTTHDGEACGGATPYVLTATNSAGVGRATSAATVSDASCGGS